MAEGSFVHVPAEGFTAFGAELRAGVWGTIDISKYIGADGRLVKAITSAPAVVVMKIQLQVAIEAMIAALKSTGSAKSCDAIWDMSEKRLGVMISAAFISKDAAKRAAAERLHHWLLLGDGAGQTKLKYHQEVDFARKQLQLVAEGQCAADVALLDLGELMQDIATATDALAEAIGHGTTGDAPSRRKTAAMTNCRNVFVRVYDDLAWMIEYGPAGTDKEKAAALHAPLVELAARYPARLPATPKKEIRAPKEPAVPIT